MSGRRCCAGPRESGYPWHPTIREEAAEKLGYTDDLGNLVDWQGNPIQSDDEQGDENSDDEHSDDDVWKGCPTL